MPSIFPENALYLPSILIKNCPLFALYLPVLDSMSWVWPRMWPWICFRKILGPSIYPKGKIDYSRDCPRAQIHLATPSAFRQIAHWLGLTMRVLLWV